MRSRDTGGFSLEIILLTALPIILKCGYSLGAKREESSCELPVLHGCSVPVLMAPLNTDFTIYCIVQSSLASDPLKSPTWTRQSGKLSNRTVITITGSEYVKNISISFRPIKANDVDKYTLRVANTCGTSAATMDVLVKEGGCQHYEAPNATHIFAVGSAVEGQPFKLYCEFNGDVSPLNYISLWNKGKWMDVVLHGSPGKYQSNREKDCPSETPCCSFTDFLMVSNATQNDSDVYSCVAWPVNTGTPLGSSLFVYIVVIPEPAVVSKPQDITAVEGSRVELPCTLRGFENSTQVQWHKDSTIIDTTDSQVYHVSRHSLTEVEFTETLSFVVDSETEGKYRCCVGYETEKLVNLVTIGGVSEDVECDLSGTTVTVSHKKDEGDIAAYVGLSAVGLILVVLLVVVLTSLFVAKRMQRRRKSVYYQKLNTDEPRNYGSTECNDAANGLIGSLKPSVSVEESVTYILYGLELERFGDSSDEEFPAYDQVVELAEKLEEMGVACYYDGKVDSVFGRLTAEEAIVAAKRVLVITSEVLRSAFSSIDHSTSSVLVHMRYSSFMVQSVKSLITQAPAKFIPVRLAGTARVVDQLQSQKVYDLQNLEASADLEELMGLLRK